MILQEMIDRVADLERIGATFPANSYRKQAIESELLVYRPALIKAMESTPLSMSSQVYDPTLDERRRAAGSNPIGLSSGREEARQRIIDEVRKLYSEKLQWPVGSEGWNLVSKRIIELCDEGLALGLTFHGSGNDGLYLSSEQDPELSDIATDLKASEIMGRSTVRDGRPRKATYNEDDPIDRIAKRIQGGGR
jgi:hypothetical protein